MGLIPLDVLGLSLWSLHVPTGHAGLLLQSKDSNVRFIAVSPLVDV